MLKLWVNFGDVQYIFTASPHMLLKFTEGKNSKCRMEKQGSYYRNQMSKADFTSIETNHHYRTFPLPTIIH